MHGATIQIQDTIFEKRVMHLFVVVSISLIRSITIFTAFRGPHIMIYMFLACSYRDTLVQVASSYVNEPHVCSVTQHRFILVHFVTLSRMLHVSVCIQDILGHGNIKK